MAAAHRSVHLQNGCLAFHYYPNGNRTSHIFSYSKLHSILATFTILLCYILLSMLGSHTAIKGYLNNIEQREI